MSDTATPPTVEGNFEIIPADVQLAPAERQTLQKSFAGFFQKAHELREQVTSITNPKLAKVARLEIKKLRNDAERQRKSLQEDARRYVNAVNGANNILLEILVPIEKAMEAIEKEEERRIEAANLARGTERQTALVGLGVNVYTVDQLGTMADVDYDIILKDAQSLYEARVKREKEEADAKLKKELEEAQERERVRAENARLLKEAQEREAAAEKERAEAAAKQKELEDRLAAERAEAQRKEEYEKQVNAQREKELADKAKRERDELEAKHRADQAALQKKADEEKAAREKLEADARAKQEEEDKKKREADEAAEAALLAPDKEKILQIAQMIRFLKAPQMKTKKGNTALASIAVRLSNLADWIEEKAEEL